MSETAFPINDLIRRRLHTSLTIVSLTTSVASTLFLLLFSGQIGFGIAATAQDTLTKGTSSVFGQFITFTGLLIFLVGAITVSFVVFLMMAQRTKDYGLMKATGCPNGLVFGYFLTELLGVTFIGCILGIIAGFATDFAVINMSPFESFNKTPNYWLAPLVFVVYFAFTLIFGAKPLLSAARLSPIKAISPVQYFGLAKGMKFKPLSKGALTIRIATRSLFRRKSATVRIILFLSVVFLLLTISIAGGIIANDTSSSWLQKANGSNVILVANANMANQYTQLLLAFSGAKPTLDFNYSDPNLGISEAVIQRLSGLQGVVAVDKRLVWRSRIQEISGYMIDPETLATIPLGDNRHGDSLIVGIEGENIVSEPFTTGKFLNATTGAQAVIGDSLAHTIYSSSGVGLADPLRQSIKIQDHSFKISGICVDPVNGGNVTYISLPQLEEIAGISSPNLLLIKISPIADFLAVKTQIQNTLSSFNTQLSVVDLNRVLEKNTAFLGSLWNTIMVLPAFALAAATLCLISFQMLTIDEQHQEFAVLRATGAKPKTIMAILAVQSLTVLLASFAVGTSLGTIVCILILITNPVVSSFTVLAISGWLLASLLSMFLLSLYPATRFSKRPILKIMS
jgi:ABC-type antimicrobial peptide transport system permease subunit